MMAPTLATERLLLLPPDPLDDLAGMAAMFADPRFFARTPGRRASTREEVWHRLLRNVGHWSVMGYGNWTVREREGGAFVGMVGLFEARRAVEPPMEGTPEAGWGIAPAFHGRGYAGEAMAAALAWADARPIERTLCMISPDNAVSIRLAERLGYRATGDGRYMGETETLYERARSAAAGPRKRLP